MLASTPVRPQSFSDINEIWYFFCRQRSISDTGVYAVWHDPRSRSFSLRSESCDFNRTFSLGRRHVTFTARLFHLWQILPVVDGLYGLSIYLLAVQYGRLFSVFRCSAPADGCISSSLHSFALLHFLLWICLENVFQIICVIFLVGLLSYHS